MLKNYLMRVLLLKTLRRMVFHDGRDSNTHTQGSLSQFGPFLSDKAMARETHSVVLPFLNAL